MAPDIITLTDMILEQVVPESTLTDDDAKTIAQHRDFLLGLEDGLVKTFYDTLFAHGPTASVFEEGERAAREQTLRDWWQRTVNGPLDLSYFRWMTLVGVVHIRRGVKNPMMVSIASVVTDYVRQQAVESLAPEEVDALTTAFSHLGSTVVSLISESYTSSYIDALQDLAGLKPELTGRMLAIEVKKMEAEGRASL
jgi:hypothetical protein